MLRLSLCVICVISLVGLSSGPLSAEPPKVRLAVHIVFDQMRGDYLEKWKPLFGARGFNRLQDDGTWFPNCYYPYGNTSTGPGHSAMLTGATLDRTGIVNNDWYDRKAGAMVYCAGSDRYEIVPATAPASTETPEKPTTAARKPKAVGNPDRLLAETVGDVLKRETNGRGKVFGLSLKDRSAILTTGKHPDGAYWFSTQFITSTYYRDTLPPWVAEFNNSSIIKSWHGKVWTKLRSDVAYESLSGPDDVKSEANRSGLGIVFPHPITGGKPMVEREYYEALTTSPFGNDLLLEFAKSCITHENLGQDDIPDLLVVSFSSNDLIGHTFGPDSQEVLDTTLRSDKLMEEFLAFLDTKVGPGNYAITLTADHGICPMPEVSAKQGKAARRVSTAAALSGAERQLRELYGKPVNADGTPIADEKVAGKAGLWIEAVPAPWLYLNERMIQAKSLDKTAVARTLAEYLRKQPEFFRVYTADEMSSKEPTTDPILELARRSFHPERSGDLFLSLHPYCLAGTGAAGTGTNHGSPHDYDRHVPLIAFGPGVKPGRAEETVTPQHSAAILSKFLGIPAPKDSMYSLPATLFPK